MVIVHPTTHFRLLLSIALLALLLAPLLTMQANTYHPAIAKVCYASPAQQMPCASSATVSDRCSSHLSCSQGALATIPELQIVATDLTLKPEFSPVFQEGLITAPEPQPPRYSPV